MQGLMQDVPLAIPHIFERAEKYHPHKGIVTATGSGLQRMSYGEWAARTRELGGVLGIYNRHTYTAEKQDALDRWALELRAILAGKSNVVKLPARARA